MSKETLPKGQIDPSHKGEILLGVLGPKRENKQARGSRTEPYTTLLIPSQEDLSRVGRPNPYVEGMLVKS